MLYCESLGIELQLKNFYHSGAFLSNDKRMLKPNSLVEFQLWKPILFLVFLCKIAVW